MLARLSLVSLALVGLSGCYGAVASITVAPSFVPEPPSGRAALAVGRDCSFHLGGLPVRELDVREAARHAVRDVPGVALDDVSARVVYPAPFEVCVEVEGTIRESLVATTSDPAAL
ncbi:hypothetical protein [Sandaracinus amylolyticus]|uniref:hypothetical protein n=1 Tax=Sandaracinus amylolyticus TaxID=927083 RepID=UPI001F34950E|nr:hypothetical protein [Sandaracinus amylolyticus]UJR82529.1 Hypothetical protein I5071_45940 [Sandaracinus amylolyticus]